MVAQGLSEIKLSFVWASLGGRPLHQQAGADGTKQENGSGFLSADCSCPWLLT